VPRGGGREGDEEGQARHPALVAEKWMKGKPAALMKGKPERAEAGCLLSRSARRRFGGGTFECWVPALGAWRRNRPRGASLSLGSRLAFLG